MDLKSMMNSDAPPANRITSPTITNPNAGRRQSDARYDPANNVPYTTSYRTTPPSSQGPFPPRSQRPSLELHHGPSSVYPQPRHTPTDTPPAPHAQTRYVQPISPGQPHISGPGQPAPPPRYPHTSPTVYAAVEQAYGGPQSPYVHGHAHAHSHGHVHGHQPQMHPQAASQSPRPNLHAHPSQSPIYQREPSLSRGTVNGQPGHPSTYAQHPVHSHSSTPGTVLGPPALPHQRSYASLHSQADTDPHARSVSGPAAAYYRQSQSPATIAHATRTSPAASGHAGFDHLTRPRDTPSLSPKTVPRSQSISSRAPSHDIHGQPSTIGEQRPPSSSYAVASRPVSRAYAQDNAARPQQGYSRPQHISGMLSGPPESPPSVKVDPGQYHQPHASPSSRPPRQYDESPRSTPSQPQSHHLSRSESLLQQPLSSHAVTSSPPRPVSVAHREQDSTIDTIMQPHKRPAEDSVEPAKRKKMRRKYDRPPIWARLQPSNPAFDDKLHGRHAHANDGPHVTHASPDQGAAQNGHIIIRDAGIEQQKMETSQILGTPWEVSITDTIPADEIITELADFLYRGMLSHPELGAGDPRLGSVEIEAKLGTLVDPDTSDRLRLPVKSMVVIAPEFARKLQFVSNMSIEQHKMINDFLNDRLRDSMQGNRVPLQYKHRREVDSFRTLTQDGINVLPPFPASEVNPHHKLKLRTTTDVDPKLRGANPVIARIVKRRLHDLSIYSPKTDYDLRISINIEVDIQGRTDIDPDLIVIPPEQERNQQPDRFKDRLSYTHTAYSIDLTQVTPHDPANPNAEQRQDRTHELEVEVDAVMLRDHALLLRDGRPNRYEDLIRGLLNNCLTLMRQR